MDRIDSEPFSSDRRSGSSRTCSVHPIGVAIRLVVFLDIGWAFVKSVDVVAVQPKTDDRFFSRFTEYVTADHAKHFILALCNEFEEDLIVVLDGAPYFRASAVTDLAAYDDLAFVTLPSYSPELNPVEECWRQLQVALSNRFFDSLDELTTAIDTALDQLSIPKVSNYF
ncbi:transposase [Natronomonas aquatica]|uniref:transposase n=1 Tax=Natronomonas aquatica TaxID=2841590 RepID=UPI00210C58D1|nr:transposase [Natronomonas aquatica]